MLRYGKMVQTAVAVSSRLAELYLQNKNGENTLASSLDIASNRHIPKPAVAKILTVLAKHGLVTGSPGPHGGYRLAKPPQDISLFDIVGIFEKKVTDRPCPLGPHWCGNGAPCALHNKFTALLEHNERFLKTTHLGLFAKK